MERLLALIAGEASFLYRDLQFRFVDSQFGGSFGDDAWVILSNGKVRLRLASDRGELSLDVQRMPRSRKEPWFPINTVRKLLLGKSFPPAGLNDETLRFLKDEFREIEKRFSKKYESSEKEMRELLRGRK